MTEAVIIEAVRTPFGKHKGAYRETSPDQLLAHALQTLVARAGIDPARIEDVIVGCVTEVGEQGANIGRRAALLAGLPVEAPALTLNRMCSSGQQAAHFAAQAVAAGDVNYVIAAGVESMTRVPMMSDSAECWPRLHAALRERYDLIHQGESAERLAEKWQITRAEADDWSAESHRRAAAGPSPELIPTPGLDAEGRRLTLVRDEGIRDPINREKMASLAPAFRPAGQGIVTAANSSQISDGAAALLIGNRMAAEADGLRVRARFRARVVVGDDPTLQLAGVIPATRAALRRAGLTMADLDWIEVNEAFATVVLAWARELRPDLEKVNPWGGAIAHGHPLGATGAGLLAKMVTALEATDGRFGLQVMCAAHGMATATIIERVGG